jgi:hypothetical protein
VAPAVGCDWFPAPAAPADAATFQHFQAQRRAALEKELDRFPEWRQGVARIAPLTMRDVDQTKIVAVGLELLAAAVRNETRPDLAEIAQASHVDRNLVSRLVRAFYRQLEDLMPRRPRGEEVIIEMRQAGRASVWVQQRGAVSRTLSHKGKQKLLPVALELLRCKVLGVSRPSVTDIAGFAGEYRGSVDRLIKEVEGIFGRAIKQ